MKVKVIFYAVKDGFAKIKGKVVGFYAELQTLKVTLSVLSANKGRPRKQNLNVKIHILHTTLNMACMMKICLFSKKKHILLFFPVSSEIM